ncbi:DUF5362 family protein [Myroides pelagicus]|uniref:DUF5362 domain-containing protein n=1 Tax=Myroides pelagicus TaxID=270914 RepID=A0A7K1GN82_9FLAO|nr:DUF5362 family protein [Myroides pelagicus]MEC4113384.1 DUF5362 family protein [Myroides pelagicus]MTH30278.1 hypothetical protein [Myroides pelagicus]
MELHNIGEQEHKFYVPDQTQHDLLETGKYTKITAVIGMAILGLITLVIVAIIAGIGDEFLESIMGSAFSDVDTNVAMLIAIPVLGIFAIIFYLLTLLTKFSKQVTEGINNQSDEDLELALESLGKYFKGSAIMTICAIGLGIFALFFAIIAGAGALASQL